MFSYVVAVRLFEDRQDRTSWFQQDRKSLLVHDIVIIFLPLQLLLLSNICS